MNEVKGKAIGLYVRIAEQHHLPHETLFGGLPVDPTDDSKAVDWDVFCECNKRLERLAVGRFELDQLGDLLFQVPTMTRICQAIQLIASPRSLYWAAHMWAGSSIFSCIENTFEDIDERTLRLVITIREPHQDSPAFFKVNQGILRTVPRLLGLPDARVHLDLSPRRGVYTVRLPPSLTLWARLRRVSQLLTAPEAVLHELRDQNEQLRRRNDELASAHVEAQRLRVEAERARDEAERAFQVKSEFLATISHELRTPLNGVVGMTELILTSPLADEQREHAETILSSAFTLTQLIDDTLDFSKMEAGRLVLERTAFDPQRLIQSVLRPLTELAHRKGVSLVAAANDALPATLLGDPARLRQVLNNLIGNALKFTEQGLVQVRAAVIGPGGERVRVRFEVCDSGIGIPPEQLTRIFEPFTQVDASTTRRFGGTGLGLSICQGLVERMGGAIGVESKLGRGSNFWFEVPFDASDQRATLHSIVHGEPRVFAAAPNLEGLDVGTVTAVLQRARVLVVDDNLVNLKITARSLERFGYEVETATDGSQALSRWLSSAYDLILMDCQMPVMDGYEATAQIRSREGPSARRTPIIAVTANAMEGDRGRCLAAGMDDYLAKPVRAEVLRKAVERWVERLSRVEATG